MGRRVDLSDPLPVEKLIRDPMDLVKSAAFPFKIKNDWNFFDRDSFLSIPSLPGLRLLTTLTRPLLGHTLTRTLTFAMS